MNKIEVLSLKCYLHSSCSCLNDSVFVCSQQPIPEKLQIRVNRISMAAYEALHYDKDQLKEACKSEDWFSTQGLSNNFCLLCVYGHIHFDHILGTALYYVPFIYFTTTGNLELPVNLTYLCMNCGKKTENPNRCKGFSRDRAWTWNLLPVTTALVQPWSSYCYWLLMCLSGNEYLHLKNDSSFVLFIANNILPLRIFVMYFIKFPHTFIALIFIFCIYLQLRH